MLRGWLTCLIGLAAVSALSPLSASAETTPRPIEIGLAGHAGVVGGNICSHLESDVVGCTAGTTFLDVQLAPRWRLSHLLSLGAVGGASFAGAPHDVDSQNWWRAEAEARVHPFDPGDLDFALGVDFGLIAVIDRVDAMRTFDRAPARTDSHLAPAIGALGELAFDVSSGFALGIEMRVFSFLFHGSSADTIGTGSFTSYGRLLGLSFGLTGTIRLGN
jgi:hypothetical protein